MLEHKACYVTCPKSWITRENSFELCNLSEHLTVDTLSRTQSLCAWCQKSDSGPSSYFLSLTASQRNLPLLYGWMLTENWSRFCSHGKKKSPKGRFFLNSLLLLCPFLSLFVHFEDTQNILIRRLFPVQMCFIALLPVTYLGSVGISWSSEYKILC